MKKSRSVSFSIFLIGCFVCEEMMPAVNSMSGVGKFSATELRKQLSGKSAGVQPSVSEYASTMNGSCSPKDIETMLQLVYLNFTQPRFDRTDYDNLMKMLRTQLENAKTNPDFQMQEKTLDVIYGHNPRRQVINTEIIDKFDFEALHSLSIEARQKLTRIRPLTIAQASRIPGVSPADINVLLVYFGR